MSWIRAAVFCFFLAGAPAWAQQEQGAQQNRQGSDIYENDPQGAVLCIWGLYQAMQIIGELCLPGEDPELKSVLTESIEKMDAFIIQNAPASREDVDKRKATDRALFSKNMSCDSPSAKAALEMYRYARKKGPAAIREDIAKLLAVPRKPVMNPCV